MEFVSVESLECSVCLIYLVKIGREFFIKDILNILAAEFRIVDL